VVLVDFWTFGCINCKRTIPHVEALYEKYKDQGFVVIGVHAPEFAHEKKPENVTKKVEEYGITYPVALDNDFMTWRAYDNRYWPALYFIDKTGKVRHTHF
jgi:thiol-disulfide isomerase/thioredoxin